MQTNSAFLRLNFLDSMGHPVDIEMKSGSGATARGRLECWEQKCVQNGESMFNVDSDARGW